MTAGMIVIPEGMKPWHGGEDAPDDWDKGPVLFREAGMSMPFPIPEMAYWRRGSAPHPWDIVAYTPATQMTLSACPFCGQGQPIVWLYRERQWKRNGPKWIAHCKSCNVTREGRTKAQAVAAWNTRPARQVKDEAEAANADGPQSIYLQPQCAVDRTEGRQWCEHDVWGECGDDVCRCKPVRYVRADLAQPGMWPAAADTEDRFECLIYDVHLPSMTARFRIPEGLPFASGMYEIRRIRRPTAEDIARWAHLPEPPNDDDQQEEQGDD